MSAVRFHDLDHGITCIDTDQVRIGMSAAYLLRGGDEYAFIECGTAQSTPLLLAVLKAKGIAPERVRYVMPTHVHLDHAAGAGTLMRALPQAQLVVHPRGARHMIEPAKLIAGATAVYGEAAMQRMYGEIVPVPEARVIVAGDGFSLDFNGRRLEFLDAPGHCRHHYAVWDADSRGFFTGDSFGLSYRDFDGPGGPFLFATTSPVQFEPDAWLETLDRFMARTPQWIYLTHYGRIGDVAKRAAELRADLEAHQRIAQDLAQAPQRHEKLHEALMTHELARLAALHCPLPAARARELLDFDIELNAQGLEVWLDRAPKS
jgi:glyoxylase-like metal-dependent hydrolase (beta-lactamase superfamily II)